MNERDIRLLFTSDHWLEAKVIHDAVESGWKVSLLPRNSHNPAHTLSSKRGTPRIFKTSDTAISWCKELGFSNISLQFEGIYGGDADMIGIEQTVLLVEDNDDDVELTLMAFQKSNLKNQVVVTKDGKQALDYLFAKGEYSTRNAEDVPNLVLLDINLPKLSGLDVLKEIRDNETTRFIPVVLLTTSDEFQDVVTGYKLGSNSYIKKPVSFQVFSDVINDLGKYWLQVNTPPPQ